MRDLVESILTGDNVEATKLFESHMDTILEKKLYEVKRSIQISEIVTPVKGKPGQFKGQNTKADWARYRKEHPSFGMHDVPTKAGKPKKQKAPEHEKTSSGGLTKKGIEARRKKGYVKAFGALKGLEFIKKVTHYHKTGEVTEQTETERKYAAASGEQQAAYKEPGAFGAGKEGKPQKGAFGVGGKRGAPKPDTTLAGVSKKLKALKSKSAATPMADRYSSALERAGRLERRGRAGSVAKVKKAYIAHRVKQGAKDLVKGAVKTWSDTLSKGMTGPLEE